MARNDIHCPSKIIPADYEFAGISTARRAGLSYLPEVMRQNDAVAAHMAASGGVWATHEHGGNCMSCGAHCFYMGVFRHRPSGEYIATGLDCAEKLGIGDVNRFRTFIKIVDAARHHAAGKRKAQGLLVEKGLAAAWDLYLILTDLPKATAHLGFTPETPVEMLSDFAEENGLAVADLLRALANKTPATSNQRIACNIVAKLVKYGSLSERQWSYLAHLMGAAPATPDAPKPAISPEKPTAPKTYTVETHRGRRSVESALSDAEAITVCRASSDTFAKDLAEQAAAGLSPRQWAWVHVLAVEDEQRRAAEKARLDAAEAIVNNDNQMDGIFDLFNAAKEHLKYPKIRLAVVTEPAANGQPALYRQYRLSVAGPKSKNPGWINVVAEERSGYDGSRAFYGVISTDGLFLPRCDLKQHPGLVELLVRFAANPQQVAAEYGRLLGNCCFCGLPLSDPRSTEVGYGKICSDHYHLPWGDKTVATPVNGQNRGATASESETAPLPVIVVETPPSPVSAPVNGIPYRAADLPAATAPLALPPAVPEVKTDRLRYEGFARLFVGEASDLGFAIGEWPAKINLVSHRTGAVREFTQGHRQVDAEGDLQFQDYTEQGGLTLRIFND